MDPISFGGTLAVAMELYEMGVITDGRNRRGGAQLRQCNEALTIMAEKTGKYEGFGKVLGLGSKRLCEKYGHPELFMGVKGQEFAGYDSAARSRAWGWATRPRTGAPATSSTTPSAPTWRTSDRRRQGPAGARIPRTSSSMGRFDRPVPVHHGAGWGPERLTAKQIDAACEGEWTVERLT